MAAGLGGLMPPVIAKLVADIGEFSAKMGEARAEMSDTERVAARTGALAKAGLLALAGGALAVGAESIHMAAQFDAAMTRINTQDNANLTTKQMHDLRNAVLDLAGPTAQAPDALAEAMIHVYGSGLKGAQALDVLRIAAEGATVGHANLTDVTNALDAAIAVNIPGVQNYQQAMGELNATVGAGDMTMQNLAEALGGPMLATVKGYGLNITDVGAALATFGDRNIRGSEAATELRMAVQALAVPAASGGKALESVGLATDTLRKDMQAGGLKQALNDLNDHLLKAGYNSQTAGTLITEAFGKKAGGGLNVLMDSLASSTSNFNDKFAEVAKSGKNFSSDWAQTQDTLAFKIKSLESAAEALGIKLGNALIPVIIQVVNWMKGLAGGVGDVVTYFKQHHDQAIAVGTALGGILLYGIYSATVAMWNMAAATLAATWPFVAIGVIIAALTYTVIYAYKHWSWFRDTVKALGDAFVWVWSKTIEFVENFGQIWSKATEPFVKAWNWVWAETGKIWGKITDFLSGIWNSLVGIWNDTGGKVVTAISNAWDTVSGAVSDEWNHIYGDLSSIWGNIVRLWNDTGGKLLTAIHNHMDGIKRTISNTWDQIYGLVSSYMRLIMIPINTGWEIMKATASIAWDMIGGIVKSAWDFLSGIVTGAVDFVSGVISGGWDLIYGTAKATWELIKGAINIPLDFLKNAFQTFTDFVTGHWGKLWSDVKQTAYDLWNGIYGTISSFLGTIYSTVVGAATNIWNGFIKGVEDAIGGIWKSMIDIWETIMRFFKDAGSWLWQIGVDIVNGLINGISSMGDAAWNAIKGIGGNIIGGAKSILGISSPSKVFHEIGTNIGQGLVNGIAGQHAGAAVAAGNLARAALAGFGTPSMTATGTVNWGSENLAAVGMSGTGIAGGMANIGGFGGNAVPDIHIYLDGSEVTGSVRTRMLRYDMRNSSNNLALAGRGFQ
ncbi:MAG: phage tail tape measure protein [Streptomyces sp.]|nr:phage tail tape measure protein [Streptomyces sp.]